MVDKNFRESILSHCVLFDDPAFDNSIIGFTIDGNVVYEFSAMINELSVDEKISLEESQEFIEYNTIRMLPYIEEEVRPVIMDFREDI